MTTNNKRRKIDWSGLWQNKALVPLAIILIVASVGVGWWLSSGDEDNRNMPVFSARRGPLTISVTQSGTLKNREQIIVKSRVQGRNTILWLIPEGAYVKKGDKLVELDGSKLGDQKTQQQIVVLNSQASFIRARENLAVSKSQGISDVAHAELTYNFAKLDLNKYLAGEYPREMQQAEAEITIATEELQRAEDKLDWSTRLAGEGYITRTELQADQLACKKTQLNLELAIGKLDLLKEYTHGRRLEQLESDVEQAKMALDREERKAAADRVQAQAELKAKQLEYKNQQSKLAKVQRQIDNCVILAPVGGMVVYATTGKGHWRGNVEPLDEGQDVREREELIYLPTTSSMIAEVKVHESSLRKVRQGLPVRIHVDALPERQFIGQVGKIGLLPDAQSAFLNPDLKVYATQIYIEQDAGDLRAGMTCRADIIVAQYADAIYVPVQSVTRVGTQHMVYVMGSDSVEARDVKVGLDNNRMIRILEGLSEGEKVLLNPPLAPSEAAQALPTILQDLPAPTTQPAPVGDDIATSQPTSRPSFDRSQLRNMSSEERRKFFENLTPEQREQLRRRQGGSGRRRRNRQQQQ